MPDIALYARKSTESEDRQILSIDSQIKELERFALNQNLKIKKVFKESKSAKAPGRPIFNEMYKDIQKGNYDSLVCWKLDRLARNPVDGGALIWAFEENKLKEIITPQRTFTNTGNDKFWMQLEFGMAKKYVDDLSDNTKRGLKAKLEQGWRPGRPPTGYVNDKENKTIIPDPERFALLRKMWELMLTGNYSPHAIIKIATDSWGLRTKRFIKSGGGRIAYSTVYAMFRNPFYYGLINFGGESYQGIHKPMVTKREFEKVQELLDEKSRIRPKHLSFAYTGLLKCGECGASITAENKTNRHGYHYVYYHCTKRKRNVHCSQKVIEEKVLESQIMEFLKSISLSKEFVDWAFKVLDDLENDNTEKKEKILKSLDRRLSSCRQELSELLNLRLRGILGDNEYTSKKNELNNEIISLNQRIKSFASPKNRYSVKGKQTFDLACSAVDKFKKGNSNTKRMILSAVGSNLEILNKKLRISPKKPFDLIQSCVAGNTVDAKRFEPGKLGLGMHKNPLNSAGLCANLRVVKDVRTFWQNSLGKTDI